MLDPQMTDPQLAETEAEYRQAVERGEHSRALELAMRINETLEPRHVEALYGIARAHLLLGRREEAYQWLDRAVEAGYWDVQRLREDEAFAGIRDEESFRAVARGAWVRGYIWMLEREERASFQKPREVLKVLSLKPGERVADVGSGSGYFTIPIAKEVGPTGTVWAIDVFQEMLDFLEKRVRVERLQNVRFLKVERDEPWFPERVDTILVIDTLHYVKDRAQFARKLREGLRPGGRVVVIDYTPKPFEERPWGPLPEQQVPRGDVDVSMMQAGLAPTCGFDFLPEQYFVIYRPVAERSS